MHYRQLRASRPPPLFELRVRAGLTQIAVGSRLALPSPRLMVRLRDYIESLLLAENFPPTPYYIAKALGTFSHLIELGMTGKPFLFKKRNSISLLFDISALQSEMHTDCPDDLVLEYTQSMMGFLLFKSDPSAIGMIGLGGGSLLKFCYRYLPQASITVAEIDPSVIALRKQFCIPNDDERLHVRCIDGADFVRQADNQFDVLMVDGFDKKGQPVQLCSQRFYDDCYHALMPDGIMVVNMLGEDASTDMYHDRICLAFNGAMIVIDAPDSSNKIVFACKGNLLSMADNVLKCRISQLEALHPVSLSLTAQSILLKRRLIALQLLRPMQEKAAQGK